MKIYKFNTLSTLAILTLFISLGCEKNDPVIEPPVVSQEIQAQIDDSLIIEYINKNDLSFTKHSSGIYYHILNEGNTTKPSTSSLVSVMYKGELTNGTVFDETNGRMVEFYLNQLILGWQYGIPLIGEGGEIKLILPSSLGYGTRAVGSIPANSILIFNIELVTVTD